MTGSGEPRMLSEAEVIGLLHTAALHDAPAPRSSDWQVLEASRRQRRRCRVLLAAALTAGAAVLGSGIVVAAGLPGRNDVVVAQQEGPEPVPGATAVAAGPTPRPPTTEEELRRYAMLEVAIHLGTGFTPAPQPPYRLSLTPRSPAAAGLPSGYRVDVVRRVVDDVEPYSQLSENADLQRMCAPRIEDGLELSACVEHWADLGPDLGPDGQPTRSGPIVQVQSFRSAPGSTQAPRFGLRTLLPMPVQSLGDGQIAVITLTVTEDPSAGTVDRQAAAQAWVDALTARLVAAAAGRPVATAKSR